MLITYNLLTEEQQLLEENIIIDKILEKKDQIVKWWKKKLYTTPKKLKKIEKKLLDYGIDVNKIKKDAKTAAEKSKIKDKKFTNFKFFINNFANNFGHKKYLTNSDASNSKNEQLFLQITKSVFLLAIVIFLSSFLQRILALYLGPVVSFDICAIIVAPLVEETAKMISVKEDMTGAYFVIFNIAEFSMYLYALSSLGLPLAYIIPARLAAVFLHLFTTIIHVEAKKSGNVSQGWSLAVIIHAIWNSLAVLSTAVR